MNEIPEKPEFLPFNSLPIERHQALLAGLYLLRLEQSNVRLKFGDIDFILAGESSESKKIKRVVASVTSQVAGPVTKKQRADILNHLQRRGEELNLL